MAAKVIKVTVINDIVCPFCYIGHVEIQTAIERCSDLPVHFDVQYRPYQTTNNIAEDHPVDKRTYYRNKLGDAKLEASVNAIKTWADRIGLDISLTDGLLSSTTRAHRLSIKAFMIGGQQLQLPVLTRLFKAYCTTHEDIGDLNVLGEIAEETGVMPKEEAIEFLKSDALKEEVNKMTGDARTVGVKGVPITIIEGKWTVHGAQPADTYVQIFRKLASSAPDSASTPESSATP